jgi:hypothetical protein
VARATARATRQSLAVLTRRRSISAFCGFNMQPP